MQCRPINPSSGILWNEHYRALLLAAYKIVQFFLEAGADVSAILQFKDPYDSEEDIRNETVLTVAAIIPTQLD